MDRWMVACLVCAAGCSAGGAGRDLRLSVTADGPTELDVGGTVNLVVRALRDDGSSSDVSERASCALSAASPPGTLTGLAFVAQQPGTTDVVCTYAEAEGRLGLSVRGERTVSIAQIQDGTVTAGTTVAVEGIVTAIALDEDRYDAWIQDPGGGVLSGIQLRDDRERAADDTLPALDFALADRVRVRGAVVESNGRTMIEYTSLEVVGGGTIATDRVAFAEIDAAWDGCLVEVRDVVVTDPAPDDYTFAIAAEGAPTGPTLRIDTLLVDATPAMGDTFEVVRGVVFPFVDDAGAPQLAIIPRTADDLTAGTVTGPTRARIVDVQRGVIADATPIEIARAVVYASDPRGDGVSHFFAQDEGGGPGSGLHFRDDRETPADLGLAVGDVVRVVGSAGRRDGHPIVWFTEIERVGTATPVASRVELAEITADPARYVGTFVEVLDVDVDDDAHQYGFTVIDPSGGADTLLVSDGLIELPSVRNGDRFDFVRGALYGTADGLELWPRSDDDLVFLD